MKDQRKYMSLWALAVLLFLSCKTEPKAASEEAPMEETPAATEEKAPESTEVAVTMEAKSGSEVSGTVVFSEADGKVTMTASFSGLEPGEHAIHLHEEADCSADDGTSTGGHWNPTYEQHGKWGDEAGYHRGDIGNFSADDNGEGSITFETDKWCISCDDPNMNILGKAVIVHQGTDDFTSQPSGAAGARISCGGVIE